MSNDTKKRIMHLIEQYGSARAQEELAGSRDAPLSTVKRYYDRGKQAWDAIGDEIDVMVAAAARPATSNTGTSDSVIVEPDGFVMVNDSPEPP
jgi:hypothetical protein